MNTLQVLAKALYLFPKGFELSEMVVACGAFHSQQLVKEIDELENKDMLRHVSETQYELTVSGRALGHRYLEEHPTWDPMRATFEAGSGDDGVIYMGGSTDADEEEEEEQEEEEASNGACHYTVFYAHALSKHTNFGYEQVVAATPAAATEEVEKMHAKKKGFTVMCVVLGFHVPMAANAVENSAEALTQYVTHFVQPAGMAQSGGEGGFVELDDSGTLNPETSSDSIRVIDWGYILAFPSMNMLKEEDEELYSNICDFYDYCEVNGCEPICSLKLLKFLLENPNATFSRFLSYFSVDNDEEEDDDTDEEDAQMELAAEQETWRKGHEIEISHALSAGQSALA